jgi:3-oxoacyl-[acyl-carrier protein] reductase
MKKIIILGSSGAIGSYLAKTLNRDFHIIATVRKSSDLTVLDNQKNISLFKVNFSEKNDIQMFLKELKNQKEIYGVINCYGIQNPIGQFKDIDFSLWEDNLRLNFLNFAFFIHKLLPITNDMRKIIAFSGGGATFGRENFSAYAIAKIALYKYLEILSIELEKDKIDLNLIAPGVIKSKMTEQIVECGSSLGKEYESASNVINSGGQDKEKILDLCRLLLSKKSNGLSGRLFAAQWDNLDSYDMNELINDKNLFTLKRIDNKHFIEKNQS